jgi:hypothetical protein
MTNVFSKEAKSLFDLAEIKRGVSLIFVLGTIVEVRAPKTSKKTQSGYFSDASKLAEADKVGIPPGFVPYGLPELTELFGSKKRHSLDKLRLVHEAKKAGGAKVTSCE